MELVWRFTSICGFRGGGFVGDLVSVAISSWIYGDVFRLQGAQDFRGFRMRVWGVWDEGRFEC